MKEIKKVVRFVGEVLGLIMGDNFTTPISEVTEKYTDNYPHIF